MILDLDFIFSQPNPIEMIPMRVTPWDLVRKIIIMKTVFTVVYSFLSEIIITCTIAQLLTKPLTPVATVRGGCILKPTGARAYSCS